jgi:iron complex transport system substrate-binding protein
MRSTKETQRMTGRFGAILAAAVTLILLASACGGASSGVGEPAADAPAATAEVEATTNASTAPVETSTGAEATGAGPWSFTDGSGKTVTLDERPTRIIAHAYAAAALMEFGITPIGVYADGPIKDDVGLQGVDFTGIEILGEEWGKIDVEKAAALRPDLIVADYWPVEKAHSGMENGVEEKSKKIAELAPVVGPAQGDSIVDLIEGYEALAASLGADVESGPAAEAKTAFETARAAFEEAVAAKPGLTALAISPYDTDYYVAVPKHAPELLDFQGWGLAVIDPKKPDADFPYWQTLSFENADTYQPDLLLLDDRNYPGNLETLKQQPIAKSIKAFAAGQHTTWPAYWLHTYGDYAENLQRLAEVIRDTDPTVGE